MEPLESHVLFVRKDGLFEVGTIDQSDGKYVQTQAPTADFSPDWTHVVAVGPHILFVRKDGLFAVGHIDQKTGHYAETDGAAGAFSSLLFSPDWSHVVAVGPHVLLVRNSDGRFEVGHIDESTRKYVQTWSDISGFTDSAHVVAAGPHVLLVRNNGLFEVGHIDESNGQYVITENGMGFSSDWTHVVAVGPHILFVRDDGLYAVGHINLSTGKFVTTDSGKLTDTDGTVFTGVTHVVAAGSRVLLGSNDEFWVLHIDEATSKIVPTQNLGRGVGGTPNPIHVMAVGPHVLGVSPTQALGYVMHFDNLGQVVETQSGPPFASDWSHVVAVA